MAIRPGSDGRRTGDAGGGSRLVVNPFLETTDYEWSEEELSPNDCAAAFAVAEPEPKEKVCAH